MTQMGILIITVNIIMIAIIIIIIIIIRRMIRNVNTNIVIVYNNKISNKQTNIKAL